MSIRIKLTTDFFLIFFFLGGEGDAFTHMRKFFLALRIRISAVFAHMRKFYLTYPIPTRWKDKKQTAARRKTSGVIVRLN